MTSSIAEIIDRQIRRWEQERRAARNDLPGQGQQPAITISSAHGARGWHLGQRVADSLGFQLYDRELIEKIALSAHVRQRVVETVDDRAQDWISAYVVSQFENHDFTEGDFLRHLSKVVLVLGHHGRAVIIGRGAHFILDPAATLRVRTVAPLEFRIRAVLEDDHLGSEREARRTLEARDAERSTFARHHFGRDITSPEHYDLVLNTATASIPQLATVVRTAYLVRFG